MLIPPDMPVEEAIGAMAVPVGVMPDIAMLAELMAMLEWSIDIVWISATERYWYGR